VDLTLSGSLPGGLGAVVREVSLDRGDKVNGIDDAMIGQLHRALDAAEADPRCRVLVIVSAPGVFSTGMNLAAAGRAADGPGANGHSADSPDAAALEAGGAFFDLLLRFRSAPLMVVSAVDGQVAGGGVGIVAASDVVYTTHRGGFALPEALWGLLPCCVLPFLVRRIGFQKAYAMTLTTRPLDADEAVRSALADELATDLAAAVRRLAVRAARLDRSTIGDLKQYTARLWPLTEDARALAVGELGRLMALPEVRARLTEFAQHGRFPWER